MEFAPDSDAEEEEESEEGRNLLPVDDTSVSSLRITYQHVQVSGIVF